MSSSTLAFIVFTKDFVEKSNKSMSLDKVFPITRQIWSNMSMEARQPFYKRAAKEEDIKEEPGVALSIFSIRKALRGIEVARDGPPMPLKTMRQEIFRDVQSSITCGTLKTRNYYFVMANYYGKTNDDIFYVPAEISLVEFNIQSGVINTFHQLINPKTEISKNFAVAQRHANTTHKLPLPPNSKGSAHWSRVFNEILDFIYDEKTATYGPLYTHGSSIEVVTSMVKFLRFSSAKGQRPVMVLPIQQLMFYLNNAICAVHGVGKICNQFIVDTFFEEVVKKNVCSNGEDEGCEYHEAIDRRAFCALSCVKKWGNVFCSVLCKKSVTQMRSMEVAAGSGKLQQEAFKSILIDKNTTDHFSKTTEKDGKRVKFKDDYEECVVPSEEITSDEKVTSKKCNGVVDSLKKETASASDSSEGSDTPSILKGAELRAQIDLATKHLHFEHFDGQRNAPKKSVVSDDEKIDALSENDGQADGPPTNSATLKKTTNAEKDKKENASKAGDSFPNSVTSKKASKEAAKAGKEKTKKDDNTQSKPVSAKVVSAKPVSAKVVSAKPASAKPASAKPASVKQDECAEKGGKEAKSKASSAKKKNSCYSRNGLNEKQSKIRDEQKENVNSGNTMVYYAESAAKAKQKWPRSTKRATSQGPQVKHGSACSSPRFQRHSPQYVGMSSKNRIPAGMGSFSPQNTPSRQTPPLHTPRSGRDRPCTLATPSRSKVRQRARSQSQRRDYTCSHFAPMNNRECPASAWPDRKCRSTSPCFALVEYNADIGSGDTMCHKNACSYNLNRCAKENAKRSETFNSLPKKNEENGKKNEKKTDRNQSYESKTDGSQSKYSFGRKESFKRTQTGKTESRKTNSDVYIIEESTEEIYVDAIEHIGRGHFSSTGQNTFPNRRF